MALQFDDNCLEITRLRIDNQEIIQYLKSIDPMHQLDELKKSLEIGVLIRQRMGVTQTADFLNVKVSEILLKVQSYFTDFDKNMRQILSQSLDPTKAESFLAKTQLLINNQVETVNHALIDVVKDTRNLLITEAGKIQNGRELLDKKMDPTNSTGYLAALVQRITEFERTLNLQFSETDSASFVGKLRLAVDEHFGNEGKVLQLIDKRLQLDPEGRTPLGQVHLNLKAEIASLRDAVMKAIGQQELIDTTTKKGYPFEQEVFNKLQEIARPYGDIVDDTSLKVEAISGSKKGDYVYRILDAKYAIVLDAKNYGKLKSLTTMLQYLKIAMQERDCRFGIIVAPDTDSLQKQIGCWGVYDNCIVTSIDYLEISIKYAKQLMQFQNASSKAMNPGAVKQKLLVIERKMKEITTLKTKLTKLSNGVADSVEDIQSILDTFRHDIEQLLQEIFTELNK